MDPAELPYTTEEEAIADQYAKNAQLLTECGRHSGQFYRAGSRLDALERIDGHLGTTGDRLLSLIKRNDLQKKALVVVALRKYGEECPLCKKH